MKDGKLRKEAIQVTIGSRQGARGKEWVGVSTVGRSADERKVAGSKPSWANTQGLQITEKKVLPL